MVVFCFFAGGVVVAGGGGGGVKQSVRYSNKTQTTL